jgi:glutathione S-transferase
MLALYHNDMSLCAQKVRVGLAEKKLDWESRHLVLRAAEHQQPWYLELNRRAVVPTLIDGEKVIPESNVILEYLDEAYPNPALAPLDAYGRARMRLWTKQLDEDVHDASAAILSFGIAFRHQYLERGELGKTMLEQIPNVFKRERRGTSSLRSSAWFCFSTRWRRPCLRTNGSPATTTAWPTSPLRRTSPGSNI